MDNDSSCPQPSFKFDPLPDPANYIRLLEILDDDNHSNPAQITCRLTTWPVDLPGLPSYHAISYTWGEAGDDTLIRLNDKPFPVRRNCEYVLRQALWHRQSQFYWVDAICIDQNNLHEKSKQVTMMGDIYKRAAHVLACIGHHADDSLFLCKKMQESLAASEGRRGIFHGCGHISWRFRLGHRSATTRRLLLALARFAMRPYFTRLWILQELRNARDFSFLCGMQALDRHDVQRLLGRLHDVMEYDIEKASILWQPFEEGRERSLTLIGRLVTRLWGIRRIMPQHSLISLPPQDYIAVRSRVFQSLGIMGAYGRDLVWLLEIVRFLDCADKRDKVYGIISIINWGDVAVITPDYTQSIFQTALNFLRALAKLGSTGRVEQFHDLRYFTSMTVSSLGLDYNSQDVPDAIRARRGIPEAIFTESDLQIEDLRSLEFTEAIAWCLSADHLDRSRSEYSIWTPTGHGDNKIYLPRWSRPGDWVLQALGSGGRRSIRSILILVREVEGTSRGLLIGRCFGSIEIDEPGWSEFQIYWDVEDLVVLCLVNDPDAVGRGSDAWLKDILDISVCKHTTPCSSFAIKSDGI